MSEDGDTNRDVRLMRALVEELRAEPVPELDWHAVERGVAAQIAPLAAWRRLWRSNSPPLAALRRASGLAAAAASVALLVAANGPNDAALRAPVDPTRSALETPSGAARGSSRETLQTGAEPRLVDVPGVGSWTLGPNSRAELRQAGETYVVVLAEGSIEARITPVSPERGMVESFAVEVGQTRVAVHGTEFSVARIGERVWVEVRRGTVAVGPTGHRGLTLGRLLVAPARAEFSLDGGREARMLAAPEPAVAVATGPGSPDRRGDERPRAAAPAPEAEMRSGRPPQPAGVGPWGEAGSRPESPEATEPAAPDEAPTAEPPAVGPPPAEPTVALSAADARAAVAGCLAAFEEGAGGSGVRVTISTLVTLHLGANRKIGSVQFSPPLRPDLQQRCASPLLGRVLAGSDQTVRFSVVAAPR